MSVANLPYEYANANWVMLDPGPSGALPRSCDGIIHLVTAGAETRTLAAPTKAGLRLALCMKTYGGNCVVTVASAYDETGGTTLTFSAAGQFVALESYEVAAGVFAWRVRALDGVTGPTLNIGALALGGTLITATAAEINQAADLDSNQEIVTATNVIAASESGKTFYLHAAGGFTSTLPAPALGLMFRFIVRTAPTGGAYVITTNGGANIMFGRTLERAGTAGVAGAARDTFNFVANQSIIGDEVTFRSDGTNWYYTGTTDIAAGNTVAAT